MTVDGASSADAAQADPVDAAGGASPSARNRSWLTRWAGLRHHPWHGALLGLLLFALALITRFALSARLPPGFPFLTFLPAVVLSTFVGGRRAGTVCAVLSVLASWYWFIPPVGSFALDANSAVALGFFVFILGVDVLVIDAVVSKQEALEEERLRVVELLERQRVLFHELQHRVANNMAMAATVLAAQQRRLAHLPQAAAGFAEARARFETMSRVHRRLHDPQMDDAQFGTYLEELCRDVVASAERPVALQVQVAPLGLSLQEHVAVALLAVELITNAVKHAFAGVDRPQLRLELAGEDGGFRLEVADNGVGLPDDFDPQRSERLGMRVVLGLARSMGGSLSTERRAEGSILRVRVPVRAASRGRR